MSATHHHHTIISHNSTSKWTTSSGFGLPVNAYRPSELKTAAEASPTAVMPHRPPHPFPTVNVPDHAHYTIGSVILAIGITGLLGNFLVIYAFSRSRSLRTPANMFIINLAVTDLLMCVTQAPVFFASSMHKRWIFGEKACELYAFCGALFGICSMITLTVIAVDRYFVITRPLTSIGMLSRERALAILAAAWVYSLGWSLPPFFGWSAYVPEGLLTSCTWDYMTFTPSVRAYTMLLFVFVFFLPLLVIVYCYVFIFRAIRNTNKVALAKYIPYLGTLLCVRPLDLRSASSSFVSTRRSTVTSQSSDISAHFRRGHSKSRLSSVSDSESGLTDTEADQSSLSSCPASRQVSCDISGDTAEFSEFKSSSSFKGKMKNHDSGIFERASFDMDISTTGVSERSGIPNQSTDVADIHVSRSALGRIPSIVITSESSPFLPVGRSGSRSAHAKATYSSTGVGSG
ncbi:melanopsin-A isoform X4 [Syngnathus scovelli]|uniref:melanopsin-A isoform X4 n=1 Tax=Syngnathus scovelli TaxID=161590 RepID=UPI00210F5FAB|nr:melanopsin-A isoform X4 [Syngnathus scovelli]